jgi:hypothetical protein
LSSPSQSIEPEALSAPGPAASSIGLVYGAFALFALGIVVFSQTRSFFWDEGFHILAARLIQTGKRPYLDFFFPQTPLNAYWNAGWMAIFGPSWRVVHAVAALATMGSVVLIAEYVSGLFPDHRWKSPAALTALALFGLHPQTWFVGTTSQAYPLCLLLIVVAFRIAIVAVDRPGFSMSALAGFCAAAAAASSLLTAPAGPVLLIWVWLNNREGNLWVKTAAFLMGGVAAIVPVLALFARGPHQVIFNILKYHTVYRTVAWSGATSHDIGVATDWVNSSPSLLLVLLALAGLFFIKRNGFDASRHAELRLCLWLPLAIGAQNLVAHPTFPMYFAFLLPFLTVLAVVGFCALVERLGNPGSSQAAAMALVAIATVCLSNSIYEDYGYTWPELEEVAAKVKQVTPPGAAVYAPEQIYFLVRGPVPSGMEHSDAHKLELDAAENAGLHILPKAEVERRLQAGLFSTAVVCENEERVNTLKEWKVYEQTAEVEECTIFWQAEKKNPESTP